MKKMLPIGVEDFEKLRKDHFYYIDKTGLISDLLRNLGDVNLFTRPRRFGKSLNMSMLAAFFSPYSDKSVFDGLQIAGDTEICEAYMGKYPVISLSLKGIDAGNYETAFALAVQLVNRAASDVYRVAADSENLLPDEKKRLEKLLKEDLSEADVYGSLYTLSEILEKCSGSRVIILIDEYDVPLARAYEHGYYDEMVLLLRNLFHQALKTNSSLKFAVLTGCMRISKESIFTGLNNLRVLSVSDTEFDAYFGFTDPEIRELLRYYELDEFYGTIKGWYDGYRFGRTSVYCPWDVICYCSKLRADRTCPPENYWINSSSNPVVRRFIEHGENAALKAEIEMLISGEAVEKTIKQELTYPELYASIDNIWSVLFTTGYLTQKERIDGTRFRLVIPNREIRYIFEEQILESFKENVRRDGEMLNRFCSTLAQGDAAGVEQIFGEYLRRTISIRDTAVRTSYKENFFHGILVGILGGKDSWGVSSNQESGEGYSDLIVRSNDYKLAIVIEVKYAQDGDLEAACKKAVEQINEKQYAQDLYDEGYERILKYGIGCYKKRCRVLAGDTNVSGR